MELSLPAGFPTQVFLQEAPEAGLLPEGPWTLLGDEAVRPVWTAHGLPEPPGTLWVPVTEAHKRLTTLLPWLESWACLPLRRDATVVAVGGGVLTDMAGLAASLYMRGIRWQAWPTTLLSQVDAGLGGKTGVDLEAGKNLAGAFHPPERLVVCRAFLRTLPHRQLEAGRWEVFKMALLEGDEAWALELLDALPREESLRRALLAKAHIVARDPLEEGERRLLNLGHTLGHALEAASGYRLLHGEAVGLGTLAACYLAEEQGLSPFSRTFLERTVRELRPLTPFVAPWEDCLPLLRRDKKGGAPPEGGDGTAIHCILPSPGARAEQRLLPAGAWAGAHRKLLASLL